ncbi:MAG: response regulator transcription factor [Candidatus Acidiferrales bacterium]
MRTRFLLVDDNRVVRQGLRTVLQANPDWEICGEANTGLAAVDLFKELHPNVVIVDFKMPGINGVETARRMLEFAPAVPIAMFTEHASPELEKHALDAGIRKVVSKIDAFPMVGIIEALLGSDGTESSIEEPIKN